MNDEQNEIARIIGEQSLGTGWTLNSKICEQLADALHRKGLRLGGEKDAKKV